MHERREALRAWNATSARERSQPPLREDAPLALRLRVSGLKRRTSEYRPIQKAEIILEWVLDGKLAITALLDAPDHNHDKLVVIIIWSESQAQRSAPPTSA